jgi:RNA polymerase sigma factor (sigma-70 family)
MLNDSQLVKMCDKLSYRYNSQTHREDMAQEGVLVCYEILAEEPDAHPAKLYREAKRRMHDYLNLDTQPVAVPAHSRSRRLARNIEDGNSGDMSEQGYEWLKLVLQTEDRPYDEDFGVCDVDHAIEFENKEYYAHVRSVVTKTLSETEFYIIKMRYYQDLTQDEVADILEVHQSWVSRHENTALNKLGDELM